MVKKVVSNKERKKRSGLYKKQLIFVWSCIVPVGILFLVFFIIPIINTIVGSFFDWNALTGRMTFTGLDNYIEAFGDRVTRLSFINTFYLAGGSVVIKIIFALILALAVNAIRMGKGLFRTVFFIPSICSMLATAFVFRFLFQPDLGTINGYLRSLGIPGLGWLQDPSTAMLTVIIFDVWKTFGMVFLIFLAGIQGIPRDSLEAAIIDGASGMQRIWYITLPLLRPVTAYNIAIQVIAVMQTYTAIVGLTNSPLGTAGGPRYATTTVVVHIYEVAFRNYRFGYGAAVAMFLFAIVLALTFVQIKFQQQKGDF